MLERQQILYNRFLNLWPMITTTFKPAEKDTDHVFFEDEDMELTGRFIAAFSFKGERHKVDSWKDMIVTLCQLIYKDSPSSIRVLCNARLWLHDNPGRTKKTGIPTAAGGRALE